MKQSISHNNGFLLVKVLFALGAGYIGGIANVSSIWFINGLSGTLVFDNQFFYKQVAWGSGWAIFYVIDVFNNNWKKKGATISIIASFFTFFIFKTLDVSIDSLFSSFFVNVLIWGGVSSFMYHKALFYYTEGK
ncbi:hypothetical protein KIT90_20545 [Vibrio sp. B172a]|uniref:hypothetical protein n=1 Tax=Vibrio sp. B172a TaxID=2835790 RepID=UPI0025576C68|nr:hypothetical protein [Vibrio sp. B172a]MDK9783772.1 hypothetical protein [Vibrio sp. B172a]